MRAAARLLLLLAGVSSLGCSSVVAAFGHPDDLSVLRRGATRTEVESELGRPREERVTAEGVEAVYRVRVGRRGSPAANAAKVASVFGDSGPILVTGGRFGIALRWLIAVPAAVGTDLILTTREIARLAGNRRDVTVTYDAAGFVVRFTHPAPRP